MNTDTVTNKERIKKMGRLAGEYFQKGYCCSEAILKATVDVFVPATEQSIQRLATGFCGGMATGEGPCGVFSGGVLAIGMLKGRINPEEDDSEVKATTEEFTSRLFAETKTMVCKEILERFKDSSEDCCMKITIRGAEILAEILEKRKWF
jgi:C_GCAxxG_C_C family probable redox protein